MTGASRFQLLLVRHGLTDWNEQGRLIGRSPVSLNARGAEQAKGAADALKSFPVAAVVASPQQRTRETAEPIASELGLEVEIDPAFDEVWLHESWQGRTVEELRDEPAFVRFIASPGEGSPFIEAIEEVGQRVVTAVEGLRKEHPGESVVVVSHGDPLRAIVAHYMGVRPAELRKFLIENGSISLLRFNPKGAQLVWLNWRPSLE